MFEKNTNHEGEIMRSKIISVILSGALTVSIITGCGNTNADSSADTSANNQQTTETTSNAGSTESTETTESSDATAASEQSGSAAAFEEIIASLHAGQSYAYAPICEGDNALLVTSYTFDDLEGHQATYEATVFAEKDGAIEKITTVQSSGTAYPIAVADDNSLIISKRNSVLKGHIDKASGKFIITEESTINYTEAEEDDYHNYKDGATELTKDSALYDELYEKYLNSEILNFQKAGVAADGTPNLAGGVYAAYTGDDLYRVSTYYVFESDTSGVTESPDGMSGLPFTYELKGEDITFHFASADDTSEAKFSWEDAAFPTITFTGENAPGTEKNTLMCLGNADPETFEATRYYDNDNNLYMKVKSFDETSLTGDLYREEKINAEHVKEAAVGSMLYSVNGTQFTAISFEDVNKELKYSTDEEFKGDVLTPTRFDGFLVKCSDDNFYYALEKEEYAEEYTVVSMMSDEILRKLIEENVTFSIKENCEIILLKFVETDQGANLENEYLIGREFKGDNYPGWSDSAKEYYLTRDMLAAIGVIDGELYTVVQTYVP